MTVPSSRSVPRGLPVRSAGPDTSSTSSSIWNARPMSLAEARRARAACSGRPAEQGAEPAGGVEQAARSSAGSARGSARRHVRDPRRRRAASARRGRAPTRRADSALHGLLAPGARPARRTRARRAGRRWPWRRRRPAGGEHGGAPAAQRRAVEHVVVHERRHVEQLHRRRGRHQALVGVVRRSRKTSIGRRRLPPAVSVAVRVRGELRRRARAPPPRGAPRSARAQPRAARARRPRARRRAGPARCSRRARPRRGGR